MHPKVTASAKVGSAPDTIPTDSARVAGPRIRLDARSDQEGADGQGRGWVRGRETSRGRKGSRLLASERPRRKNWGEGGDAENDHVSGRETPGIFGCHLGRPRDGPPPENRGPAPMGGVPSTPKTRQCCRGVVTLSRFQFPRFLSTLKCSDCNKTWHGCSSSGPLWGYFELFQNSN